MLTRSLSSNYLPSGSQENNAYTWTVSQMQELVNASRTVSNFFGIFFSPFEVISGKISLNHTINGLVVSVPYWISADTEALNSNTLNILSTYLSTLRQGPVQVNYFKVLSPMQDAYILAHFLTGEFVNTSFRNATNRLFSTLGTLANPKNHTSQTGTIIGVKVRLAGRLLKETSRPRQTIQIASVGTLTANSKHFIQAGSYSMSNLKGALTVKVWICVKN